VFIYILCWKNEIVLFCQVYKVTPQNKAGGNHTLAKLYLQFLYNSQVFFSAMVLL